MTAPAKLALAGRLLAAADRFDFDDVAIPHELLREAAAALAQPEQVQLTPLSPEAAASRKPLPGEFLPALGVQPEQNTVRFRTADLPRKKPTTIIEADYEQPEQKAVFFTMLSSGTECGSCGFSYFAHQGHLIPCPLCALATSRKRVAELEHALAAEQGLRALAESSRDNAYAHQLAAERALAECRADAERYRWLRDGPRHPLVLFSIGAPLLRGNDNDPDAAIDAARAGKP